MRLLRVTWRLGAFAVGDSRSVGRRSSSIEAAGSEAWPFVYLVSSIRFRPLDQTMRLLRWFCVHDSPTGNRNGMASCRSSSIGWILDSIFSKQQASRPLGAKFLSHSFSASPERKPGGCSPGSVARNCSSQPPEKQSSVGRHHKNPVPRGSHFWPSRERKRSILHFGAPF